MADPGIVRMQRYRDRVRRMREAFPGEPVAHRARPGRPPRGDRAMTGAERMRALRARRRLALGEGQKMLPVETA